MPSVADILARKGSDVVAVLETHTVLEVARIMADRRIGSVVVQSGERIVGIFTERDVLYKVVSGALDPKQTLVRDVMSTPVACCQRATKIAECMAVMAEKKLRRLPVVEHGRLMGIVTIGDIMAFEATTQAHTIEYLHEYLYGRT